MGYPFDIADLSTSNTRIGRMFDTDISYPYQGVGDAEQVPRANTSDISASARSIQAVVPGPKRISRRYHINQRV